MDDFYLERHFKLWEDNNTLLKRIVFLTVIISLSLVVNVLIPFVDFSGDKKPLVQIVDALKIEKESVNQRMTVIIKTGKTLKQVSKFIVKQPWQREKDALIQTYRSMRRSSPAEGYSSQQYQQKANDTINNISVILNEYILIPLQNSNLDLNTEKNSSDKLNDEIDLLNRFIAGWKEENINVNWFGTISRKDRTMNKLTEDLNLRLKEFSKVVKDELASVRQIKVVVSNELDALNKNIEKEAGKLQALDDELQKILPEWLRGLVDIEQVVQLLPIALLGSVAFVLFIGVSLTRHYNIFLMGKKISSDLTVDPGMSSVWTLINRGKAGSIQTVLAYTLFIVFTWLVYEQSIILLLEWLAIDTTKAWISSVLFWQSLLWISRFGFMVLLYFILKRLWVISGTSH